MFGVVSIAYAGNAKTGAAQYDFYHAYGTLACPPYCPNIVEGASGKLIINQPNGQVSVGLTVIFNDLVPFTTYTVYIQNYYAPGAPGWLPGGTWADGLLIGTFTTDEYGHGDFHYNVFGSDVALGTYNWSVWINNNAVSSGNRTLFISDNFEVVIE